MTAAERDRPQPGERTASTTLCWSLCALFAIVLGLALDLHWSEFSLVQPLTRVDARAFRYFIAHHDDGRSKLDVENAPDGVRIRGSARKLGVLLHGSTIVIETECARGVPHVHRAYPTDELALHFEAKSELPGAGITAVAAPSQGGHRYSARRALRRSWTHFRVPLSEMGPGGATFPDIPFPFLMLMFEPATEIDAHFRRVRMLREPRAAPPP